MNQGRESSTPKIAYLIKCFPRLSETFILHEVLELERQGLPLRIFSLRKPAGVINQAAQQVRAPITFIPPLYSRGLFVLIAAAVRRFLSSPVSLLRICISAIIRFHHLATPKHLIYALYVAEQLEREGITHLHAHYANAPATIALLAHQFTGIPFSFTAHAKDIYLSRKSTLTFKMKQARFVVTCTGYNQQYLEALLDHQDKPKIHRIYHGLDLRAFPAQANVSTEPVRPLILAVARLVEKKGLSYLLQACRQLLDQGYDFSCCIIGEGPLRGMLEQQILDYGLVDRIELRGAEKHERVIEMYQRANVLALPCVVAENGDRDGIPNVLVEALYMGVPVVTTPISGIPELIESESNGLLVPPRDSSALGNAIARLLDDSMLRKTLAEAGRQTVLARFDTEGNTLHLRQLLLAQEPTAIPGEVDAAANASQPCSAAATRSEGSGSPLLPRLPSYDAES